MRIWSDPMTTLRPGAVLPTVTLSSPLNPLKRTIAEERKDPSESVKRTQPRVGTESLIVPTSDFQLRCQCQRFQLPLHVHHHGVHSAIETCEQLWGVVGVHQSDAGLGWRGVEGTVIQDKPDQPLVCIARKQLLVIRIPAKMGRNSQLISLRERYRDSTRT